jgi:hypothetical protein
MLARMGGSFARRIPAALRLWLALAIALCASSWASDASAYAWMIRHGYTACGTCHQDPSGGELLTPYGRVQGDLLLAMHYGGGSQGKNEPAGEAPTSEGPSSGVLWGLWEPPDWLAISGAYRNLNVVQPSEADKYKLIPVMQADLYGQLRFGAFRAAGSVGIAKVKPGSPNARAAQVTTGQGDELNMISRTHWIGVDFWDKYTLRAGRLNLPFGVRIPEHTMWVREKTQTDRESDQQAGVALAYVGESLRGEVMAIAGNYQINPDEFRERGYSLYVEGIATNRLAAGASSKVTFAKKDRYTGQDDVLRQAHGLMARYAPWDPLAILFEADMLFRTETDAGYVGFLQLDYEIIQGLHLLATGEVLDEGLSTGPDALPPAPGTGEPRYGFWGSIDWFFYRQFEARVDFIQRQEEPFTILGQVHFYL